MIPASRKDPILRSLPCIISFDLCLMHGYILLQFLLIYRKARAGELEQDSGLSQLARLTEVDVDEVGVTGAKHFFEAKVHIFPTLSKVFSDRKIL